MWPLLIVTLTLFRPTIIFWIISVVDKTKNVMRSIKNLKNHAGIVRPLRYLRQVKRLSQMLRALINTDEKHTMSDMFCLLQIRKTAMLIL